MNSGDKYVSEQMLSVTGLGAKRKMLLILAEHKNMIS